MKKDQLTLNRKIRIGLVGCGRIANNHVEAIRAAADSLELLGVCDIIKSRAEDFSKKTGARPFEFLPTMLGDLDLDVVSVCTPSGLHAEHSILAAESGAHVICEKPMALKVSDGAKMIEAAQKNKVQLFVVKQNRKNPTIQLLKRVIDQGLLGKIYLVQSNVFWTRPQSYYDAEAWRGKWSLDGGVFMNQASHYVDLLQWLVGDVAEVCAMTATLARKIETEDTGVVSLKYKSGAVGSLNVTVLTYKKNFEGSLLILGEKGTVKIGGVALNKVEHWDVEGWGEKESPALMKASYETESVYGKGHLAFYENVVGVLRGQARADVDGTEGLKSLKVLESIYESARSGKPQGVKYE